MRVDKSSCCGQPPSADGLLVLTNVIQVTRPVAKLNPSDNHSEKRHTVLLSELAARQGWGDVITRWIIDGPPSFSRILEQKDVLLQISLPASGANAPGTTFIETLDGKTRAAKFLSAFPRVDPRLQTPSFLYETPSRPDFVSGMTLGVLLPSGPLVRGISVPSKAIIWLQGKAWAYVQTAQGKFLRREVSTQVPIEGGWLATEGFSAGDKIVVTGAQQLLSEEFRSQTHVIGEEDEKN